MLYMITNVDYWVFYEGGSGKMAPCCDAVTSFCRNVTISSLGLSFLGQDTGCKYSALGRQRKPAKSTASPM